MRLIWKTWFLEVLNKHAPESDITIKGTSLPYITMEIRQMIRKRDYLSKMANKTGSPCLWQAFQQIRNKVTYGIRKARADYYSETIEKNKGDLRKTWKVLKQAINKDEKLTVVNQINRGGQVITEKHEILETFNKRFVSTGEKLAPEIPPSNDSSLHYLSKTKKAEAKFHFKKIDPNQVHRLLDKLKTGKASGMDLMSNKFLKIAKNILAKSLCDIFNTSIESKIFPRDFKIAKVTPIFKGGLTDDLSNYHPMSVLSTIARIFEKLLYSHLYEFLTENDTRGNRQWGFRSLHSTAHALIDCSNNWFINIDRGGIMSTVLLDIKKAFDTIDHEILQQKLEYYDVGEEELRFFKSYLTNRKQCCNMNNQTSGFKVIK